MDAGQDGANGMVKGYSLCNIFEGGLKCLLVHELFFHGRVQTSVSIVCCQSRRPDALRATAHSDVGELQCAAARRIAFWKTNVED